MYYDVVHSSDDGFWYIDAYSRSGRELLIPAIQEATKNEFESSSKAISTMRRLYPSSTMLNVESGVHES